MEEFIIEIVTNYGYLGVFLLIMIENIFPPIPSEVILLFSGFMIKKASLNIFYVIFASTIGSMLGAIILYYVGRLLNHDRLMLLVNSKVGKILRFKEKDINSAVDWFNNRGNKTVFFCRFVPIVRSLISIPAGISKMKMRIFLPYTLLGSVIWNSVLVYLGNVTGENWESIISILYTYKEITIIVLFILFILFVIGYLKKKKIKFKRRQDE